MQILIDHTFAYVGLLISLLALLGISTGIIRLIKMKRVRYLLGSLPIYTAGSIFAIHFIDQKIHFLVSHW
jgi:hypothetical protein